MTFTIAAPSADDIKKAPRAFGLYRQALAANGTVDAKVRCFIMASWFLVGCEFWL